VVCARTASGRQCSDVYTNLALDLRGQAAGAGEGGGDAQDMCALPSNTTALMCDHLSQPDAVECISDLNAFTSSTVQSDIEGISVQQWIAELTQGELQGDMKPCQVPGAGGGTVSSSFADKLANTCTRQGKPIQVPDVIKPEYHAAGRKGGGTTSKADDSASGGGGNTGTIIGVAFGIIAAVVLVAAAVKFKDSLPGNAYAPVEMVDLDGAADDIKEDDDDELLLDTNDPVMGSPIKFTPPDADVQEAGSGPMRFCLSCHAAIANAAEFCPECGTSVPPLEN